MARRPRRSVLVKGARRPGTSQGKPRKSSDPGLGAYIREVREHHRTTDPRFSLRQVAQRIHVQPAYLSQVERGNVAPPSEATIRRLAKELNEDPDVLLALAGKVSHDLQEVIRGRPQLFAELLRSLKAAPNHAVLRVVREVRDGKW